MTSLQLFLGAIAAISAGLCILLPSLAFDDCREHPWRLLIVVVLTPLVTFGLGVVVGISGLNCAAIALVYSAGLSIAALTVAWRYHKTRSYTH